MKIKTIRFQLDSAEKFDDEVNTAIEQGWLLSKREVLPGGPLTAHSYEHRMLYAELVLPDPQPEPVEPDLFACVETIRLECERHQSCRGCPLDDVCNCSAPSCWSQAE